MLPTRFLLQATIGLSIAVAGCQVAPNRAAVPPMEPDRLHFTCGGEEIWLAPANRPVKLFWRGESFELEQAPAASGVLYRAPGAPETSVHEKAGRAVAVIRGSRLRECLLTTEVTPPFRAIGQEPPWLTIVEEEQLVFITEYGQRRETLRLREGRHAGSETRFAAANEDGALVLSAVRRLCRDSMSGMPHPYTATVWRGGESLRGCGGAPIDLLAGRTWVIEDLDGGGIIDRSRITVEFVPKEGRIAGRASCNRFSALYALSGEGLTVAPAAVTPVVCADALMVQEQKFLRILATVYRFDFADDGALLLIGREGTMRGFPEPSP